MRDHMNGKCFASRNCTVARMYGGDRSHLCTLLLTFSAHTLRCAFPKEPVRALLAAPF